MVTPSGEDIIILFLTLGKGSETDANTNRIEGSELYMCGEEKHGHDKHINDTHMNKVLTRYDPNGCPYAFLIVYTTVKQFDEGYEKIFNYFKEYKYPFSSETELMDVDTGYGELKHAQIILNRNGQKTRVHIWVAHII